MKKRVVNIFFIIFIIILITSFIVVFNRPNISYDNKIITDNKDEYTIVAKLLYQDYSSHRNNNSEIFFYSHYIEDFIIEGNSKERNIKHEIELTDNEYHAFEIINSTFKLNKHNLENIYVYDSFVVFAVIDGQASFIYSNDNSEPSYINFPNEDFECIYVGKITDNWYYACNQK